MCRIIRLRDASERISVSDSPPGSADCLPRFFALEGTHLAIEVHAVPKERPHKFANLFVLEGKYPAEIVAMRLSLQHRTEPLARRGIFLLVRCQRPSGLIQTIIVGVNNGQVVAARGVGVN